MKKLTVSLFLVSILISLALPAPARAQITGRIGGTVRDPSRAVLPGTTVTASSPDLHRTDPTGVTGQDGRFVLVGLPAGVYKLTVELSGFATGTVTDLRLGINDTLDLDIVLQLAGVETAITVVGGAILVGVKDSGLGHQIRPEVIDSMPLNGRQFLDLVGLVPGTAPRPVASDQGSGITVFGERSVTNSFLVDGMENNDDYTRDFAEFYIQDVIQEFKVELGGYQAEYGRASGAIANVITRSGTNDFRARAFLFGREDALDSSNVAGQEPPELRRTEVGGYLGGPINQDKTWFFGALQHLKETRGLNFDLSRVPQVIRDGWFTPTVGNESFDASPTRRNITTFGKINHEFGKSNQLFATVNLNLGENKNGIPSATRAFGGPPPGSIALPSTASDIETNTYSATTRHTLFLSNTAFV